jgi:hypothetical protein
MIKAREALLCFCSAFALAKTTLLQKCSAFLNWQKQFLPTPLLVENYVFQPQKLEKLLLACFAGDAIKGSDGLLLTKRNG